MVANRKRFWVTPHGDQWQVKAEGGRVLSTHYLKDQAVSAGVRVAKDNMPSQLLIMNRNGQIEDERTYEYDPFPPRG